MRRRIVVLLAMVVMTLGMIAASAPVFAQGQGPEGGNPGQGICKHNPGTAGESGNQPLPFGGTKPQAGFENAPQGVVFTSPGSPFSAENPSEC